MNNLKRLHIGKKFGKLFVQDQIPCKKSICICDCGEKTILPTSALTSGHTTSCGCLTSINRKNYDEDMRNKIKSYIEINDNDCWVWKKSKQKQGYGVITYKRKVQLAHRVSFKIFNGYLPDDLYVCHKCDNPSCCNPDHLFLGTNSDNIKDAFSKGRVYRPKGEDHYYSKLKESDVVEIRELAKKNVDKQKIADKFKISLSHADNVIRRRSWKHVH